MPNLILTPEQMADVIAYILSLREHQWIRGTVLFGGDGRGSGNHPEDVNTDEKGSPLLDGPIRGVLAYPGKATSGVIDPTRTVARQHFLNFFPLPQAHGSFRPTPLNGFSSRWLRARLASASRRHRCWSSRYCVVKQYHPDNSSTVSPNSVSSRSSGRRGSPGCAIPRLRSSSKWSNPRTWLSIKPRSNAFFTRMFRSLMPRIAMALCQPTQT